MAAEIKIAIPNPNTNATNTTTKPHSMFQSKERPNEYLIIKKTGMVGKNLKRATMVVESGSAILGNAVFRIKFSLEVIDLVPLFIALLTK